MVRPFGASDRVRGELFVQYAGTDAWVQRYSVGCALSLETTLAGKEASADKTETARMLDRPPSRQKLQESKLPTGYLFLRQMLTNKV